MEKFGEHVDNYLGIPFNHYLAIAMFLTCKEILGEGPEIYCIIQFILYTFG
jgi:hypothetical protein